MADRYTYIPLIGLFIMVAWGVPDLLENQSFRKQALAALAAVILVVCLLRTSNQLETWRDRESLYAHAARVIPNNYWAYNNLGSAMAGRGDMDQAATYFLKSLEVMPLYPGANKNMAGVLYKKGLYREALPYMERALVLQGRNPEYQVAMGLIWMKLENITEAAARFQEALRLDPAYPDAHEALAEAAAMMKKAR
jgi:Tfp pilus assembly protein PilF